MSQPLRVRFAPSPTGMMHVGNLRVALFNFLFARQQGGTFILRIEDTDGERTVVDGIQKFIETLEWAGITFDEGPGKEDPAIGSYLQSQRAHFYQAALRELREKGAVYRCYCTPERLEILREAQREAHLPPRYDGKCRALTSNEHAVYETEKTPFVERFICNPEKITVMTGERGPLEFDMSHFADPVIARADGSATFLFANCVDDCLMKISHVIRGDDHLNNTPLQVLLYRALGYTPPVFIHLPLMCNNEGKKMSKRDFGFSIDDLRQAGILPQALSHYLYMLGKTTILGTYPTLEALATTAPALDRLTTNAITYDFAALKSLNHAYIQALESPTLLAELKRFSMKRYVPIYIEAGADALCRMISACKSDSSTLDDLMTAITRIVVWPKSYDPAPVSALCGGALPAVKAIEAVLKGSFVTEELDFEGFYKAIETSCKSEGIPVKHAFCVVRYAAISQLTGMNIKALLSVIDRAVLHGRLLRLREALLASEVTADETLPGLQSVPRD